MAQSCESTSGPDFDLSVCSTYHEDTSQFTRLDIIRYNQFLLSRDDFETPSIDKLLASTIFRYPPLTSVSFGY